MSDNLFLDSFDKLTGQKRVTRRKAKAVTPEDDVTVGEDRPSIFSRAKEASLSGLGAIGNALDLPGSMVRDLVHTAQTGTFHNPLDQLLSPFSDKNRASGRDIGRAAGAMSSDDTTGNWFGGLGIEIATDPLSYLTLGANAVGKGGKAMKAAGLMDDVTKVAAKKAGRTLGSMGAREARVTTTVDDMLHAATPAGKQAAQDYAAKAGIDLAAEGSKPLGGIAGIGLPFMDPSIILGTGKTGQRVAQALDTAGSAIKHAKVPFTKFEPLNELSRLFDAKQLGTKTREGQAAARGLFDVQTGNRAAAGLEGAELAHGLDAAGLGTHADSSTIRAAVEARGTADPAWMSLPHDAKQAILKAADSIDELRKQHEEWGTGGKQLEDLYAKYWPREMTEGVGLSGGKPGQPFTTMTGSRKGRENYLKDIQGGTETIKQIFQDPTIDEMLKGGSSRKHIADFIEFAYGDKMSKTYQVMGNGGKPALDKSGKPLVKNRFRRLAAVLAKVPDDVRKSGLFGNHPAADFEKHLVSARDSIAAGKTILETIAQPGIVQSGSQAAQVPGTKTLRQVLQSTGIAFGDHEKGGLKKLWDLTSGGAPLPPDPKVAWKNFLAPMLDWRIDEGLADDMARMNKAITGPEAASEIITALDSFSNIWKAFQTGVWPKFHVRNLLSGQVQNWIAGMFSAGSVKDAEGMMRGKAVKGASQIPEVARLAAQRGVTALDDDTATKLLSEIAYAHKVVGKYDAAATVGKVGDATPATIEGMLSAMPGENAFDFKQVGRKFIGREPGTNFNPFDVRGVGNRTESGFGPAAAGEDAGYFVEGLNRMAPFIDLLKKGWSADAAAKKVGEAQVLYQNRNYTKFESQAMARALPFYKFAKGMLPYTLNQLAERPGGKLAQIIRAEHRAHGADEMTPEYIADTASIPLSKAADGTRRYITGLGLMHEDPLSLFGGGPQGMALEAASRMNPILKAPLEYATGETFFQKGPSGGRELEDLDPQLGRILANVTGSEKAVKFPGSQTLELLLGNSPLSSALTQVRTATDPRKGVAAKASNLLTGVRVSDVSPGAQDAILRQQVQQMEKELGAKKYVKTYFPAAEKEKLSPHDRALVEELIATEKQLQARAKTRKAAKEKAK